MNIIEQYELFGSVLPSETGIYAIANKVNGKMYIGSAARQAKWSSWTGVYYRFNSTNGHRKKLLGNIHHAKKLQNAFNKCIKDGYNPNDIFEIWILEYCPADKCLEREQWYFDTYKPWYNSCLIAGSTLGYKHTDETKKLMSEKSPRRKLTSEQRRAVSEANKGKVLPDWHVQKLIESNKRRGKLYLGISPSGEEFIFRGADGFAKDHNLQPSHITACARGKTEHHKGWKFSYYEENVEVA
jgi:group I intron endonuclease